MRFFLVPLFVFGLLACGKSPSSSSLDGHYENSSPAEANAFKGQQRVPAEFAPSDGVVVSYSLVGSYGREDLIKAILDAGTPKVWMFIPKGSSLTLQSSLFARLRQVLGDDIRRVQLVAQKDNGSLTVWARDWAPIGAVSAQGIRLLDFNYYPSRPADDASSRALAEATGLQRISVPVYNEGGNFMVNQQGYCLMSSRVTDANSEAYKNGDLILDAEEIERYYRDFAGCRQVKIFPRMPMERTGHIDMWAKFLDDKTVIVNELREETLATARSQSARAFAEQIGDYLDARAEEIQALGFRVQRIPMPLPSSGYFRSYTNSLVVNGTAIVPQYTRKADDANLIAAYEEEVLEAYQDSGYKAIFIPSDNLISAGGAVHCVTMQVPSGTIGISP